MASEPRCTVVLFGYRNDVARARVREFLRLAATERPASADVDGEPPLPIGVGLVPSEAEMLAAHLRQLGAQVRVVTVAETRAATAAPDAARRAPSVPHRGARLNLAVLLVLLATNAVLWWQQRLPRPAGGTRVVPFEQWPGPAATDESSDPPLAPAADAVTGRLNSEAVRLAAAGHFAEAIDRLRLALHDAPEQAALSRNLQTALLNLGTHELMDGAVDLAVEHLQEAAHLGERAAVLRVLGAAYARLPDDARATSTLEQALALAPSDTEVMLTLAEVYLRQGDRPQALELLQRAREAGARSAQLDTLVTRLGREVDTEWEFVALDTPHFHLSFADDEDHRTVAILREALEDAYREVGRKLGFFPEGRTPVVLYARQDFHTVTETPDWAGAAFDGRIKIPVGGLQTDEPDLERVVRHEFAHRVIAQLAGARCPTWLNEGVAVWAEEHSDGERVAWAEARVAEQPMYAFSDLQASFAAVPRDRVGIAYAQSYLAVRWLVDRYGARKLQGLLEAIGRTGSVVAAYAEVYPGDFARFCDDFMRQYSG